MGGERAAAISGRGAVSSLGGDCSELWEGIRTGASGIATITRFDTSEFSVRTGAQVAPGATGALAVEVRLRDSASVEAACVRFAGVALREALRDAGLWDEEEQRSADPAIAFVFGTGLAELSVPLHEVADQIARDAGLTGARFVVSTACSSSTTAIGLGLDLLAMGSAQTVVAGGADVLTPEVFAGFHALGVLTAGRCAPYSSPPGTTLGEGAGFLVLEPEQQARARGAPIRGVVAGYGLSCDAWHETSPDPTGAGIERVIRSALEDAGITAAAVDYVNAHGSGTRANDAAEWIGIRRALSERTAALPVSSSKGALGHAQGAAGALEAIVTLEAMHHGTIPPTLNFAGPRPHAPPDPVPGPFPRALQADRVVTVNSAFGGANAALVITRVAARSEPAARRRLVLRGVGVLEPDAGAEDEVLAAVASTDALRRCDPAARALAGATLRALQAAHHEITGRRRDRCGLFVGQRRPSSTSLVAFDDSIARDGLPRLSASAFSQVVLNAAAGTCARLLGLRGAHTVVAAGGASGLAALVLAAEHLVTRPGLDALVAAAVDEWGADDPDRDAADRDGAIALLLAGADVAPATPGLDLTVAGWGIGAPHALDDAIAGAAPLGLPAGTLQLATPPSSAAARASLRHVVTAGQLLRCGECDHVLVTACAPGAISAALLLSR